MMQSEGLTIEKVCYYIEKGYKTTVNLEFHTKEL